MSRLSFIDLHQFLQNHPEYDAEDRTAILALNTSDEAIDDPSLGSTSDYSNLSGHPLLDTGEITNFFNQPWKLQQSRLPYADLENYVVSHLNPQTLQESIPKEFLPDGFTIGGDPEENLSLFLNWDRLLENLMANSEVTLFSLHSIQTGSKQLWLLNYMNRNLFWKVIDPDGTHSDLKSRFYLAIKQIATERGYDGIIMKNPEQDFPVFQKTLAENFKQLKPTSILPGDSPSQETKTLLAALGLILLPEYRPEFEKFLGSPLFQGVFNDPEKYEAGLLQRFFPQFKGELQIGLDNTSYVDLILSAGEHAFLLRDFLAINGYEQIG